MLVAWILLILLGASLAVWAGDWIPAIVSGVLLAGAFFWVLISALSPAIPCRICPKCGREGLVKIRRGVPGARCEKCDFIDEDLHVAYLDDW